MMMDLLYSKISPTSPAAVIISVALMMILGFIMTRVTGKLRLPNVRLYLTAFHGALYAEP